MLVFTGTFEHQIDAKKRVAIPSEIRALIQESEETSEDKPTILYVTLGEDKALCIYTRKGFEQRAAELDNSQLDPSELLIYERLTFSLARRVELDKQGRVLLPDNLLEMSGLGTEVVLIGVKDHMEIRDRTAWNEHVRSILAQRPGLLMNPRRAMKANPTPAAPVVEAK